VGVKDCPIEDQGGLIAPPPEEFAVCCWSSMNRSALAGPTAPATKPSTAAACPSLNATVVMLKALADRQADAWAQTCLAMLKIRNSHRSEWVLAQGPKTKATTRRLEDLSWLPPSAVNILLRSCSAEGTSFIEPPLVAVHRLRRKGLGAD